MKTVTFYEDSRGEHRWRMEADNAEPISNGGQGYKHQDDCIRGFELSSASVVVMDTGEAIRWLGPEEQEHIKIDVEV